MQRLNSELGTGDTKRTKLPRTHLLYFRGFCAAL